MRHLAIALSFILIATVVAHADIFEWEYIDPENPSLGKQESATLTPDGAGKEAVSGADLSFLNLTKAWGEQANLAGTDFSYTNLTDADFFDADLTNISISGANLTNADFSGATLTGGGGVYFNSDTTLTGTKFSGADLSYDIFSYTKPTNVDFSGAHLPNVYFDYATLTDTHFSHATLTDVSFLNATLTGTDFSGANLAGTNTNFYGANLTDISFRSATLTGAHIWGATLINVDFFDAELSQTDFSNTVLTSTPFRSATLTNANFYQATLINGNFSGADLTDADFSSANLTGTHFSGATIAGVGFFNTNLTGADFSGAHFSSTDTATNFITANLTNANLSGTDLSGVIFSDADLTNVDARGATNMDYTSEYNRPARTRNFIQPDGVIQGLALQNGETLRVWDYNADTPLPITVTTGFFLAGGSTLRLVFEDNAWGSTLVAGNGVNVTLDGELVLALADGLTPADIGGEGAVFQIFDWSHAGTITGQFTGITLEGDYGDYTWDTSHLYTTGEITLVAVPEPAVSGSLLLGIMAAILWRMSARGSRFASPLGRLEHAVRNFA